MPNIFLGFGLTLICALVVIAGDTLIKLAADGGKPVFSVLVLGGCGVYALSAIFWFFAMRHMTLAQAGVAFSMLTLLALCAIGTLWFGEKLYTREVIGVGFALAAMVLLMRVA